MNLRGLQTNLRRTYPILPLEKFLPHRRRRFLSRLLGYLVVILAAAIVCGLWRPELLPWPPFYLVGAALVLLSLALALFLLDCWFFWLYFRSEGVLADLETAKLVAALTETDVTGSFLAAPLGAEIMLRAGVPTEAAGEFLRGRVGRLALAQLVVEPATPGLPLTPGDLARALVAADRELGDFLLRFGIQSDDLAATAEWLARRSAEDKIEERWWSREILGRIPGIAKDWSYGQAYHLERYATPLPALSPRAGQDRYRSVEVKKIEAVLAREREDNVMLIGDDHERKLEIVALLARMIEEGKIAPPLEHKQITLFNAATFSAGNDNKGDFEREFIRALNEAVHAGNRIVVFPEFTDLAQSAEKLGTNLAVLLETYLTSPDLQIIALSTTDEFHRVWEPRTELLARFEKVLLEDVAGVAALRVLEDEAVLIERSRGVWFTRPALQAIVSGAERYFPGGILPDAAIDLAFDLASQHRGSAAPISREEVESLIKTKTGIPVGAIGSEEREKLVNLEQLLHERIIGQNEAITGVANALRRSRAGISNPNRPIGTFLFLGPTGVGKTETTKALAKAYFGDENKIDRLDMSEYSSPDALDKLIGSFSGGEPGVLTASMREHAYGILLLDEFEKASPKVHNLFLQILDEGFFSDMAGKRVSVRNHLIIATSNAGSDLIWQTLSSGADLLAAKPQIIDELVRQGIFKPELLNRFDGVILFHPLSSEALQQVARLMLNKLAERLRARGIILEVTDDLVAYLAEKGTDIKFGARAMNRAIQDTIEQAVANKIVIEGLKPGQKVSLSRADVL